MIGESRIVRKDVFSPRSIEIYSGVLFAVIGALCRIRAIVDSCESLDSLIQESRISLSLI